MLESSTQGALFDVGPTRPTKRELAKAERERKAAEKASAKTEAERARGEAHRRVIETYDREFTAARGTRPLIRAAEGRAVKTLLDAFHNDVERVIRLIVDVFNDPYWRTRTGVSLLSIAADPSKFERNVSSAARSAGRFGQAACAAPTRHESFDE